MPDDMGGFFSLLHMTERTRTKAGDESRRRKEETKVGAEGRRGEQVTKPSVISRKNAKAKQNKNEVVLIKKLLVAFYSAFRESYFHSFA